MLTSLLLFIVILGVTVCVHEFGHYIFAKMVGIRVYEFAIGMGPAIFKSKPKGKDETVYSIRAIPIGGYCSLAGEEVDVDRKKNKGRTLQDKPVWQRFLVMFFGAGFNFIFAFIIMFLSGLFFGTASYKPIVNPTSSTDPMYIAGLRDKDKIVKVNGNNIKYFDDARIYIGLNCSKNIKALEENKELTPVSITVERDNSLIEFKVNPTIKDGDKKTCIYGFSKDQTSKPNIIDYAFNGVNKYVRQMFMTFKLLFSGEAGLGDLSGPIGIYTVVGQVKNQGLVSILELIVLLNINVGFINLLPFPAFDGGRILFLIIEKLKGSPVNPKTENIIHTIGFVLLILLMLYVTFNDVLRLF